MNHQSNNDLDINEIFENARKDASLLSTIDIDELLRVIEQDKSEYLENKTIDDIIQENISELKSIGLNSENIRKTCEKLTGYRHVDNLYDLHKGKHIRWIRRDDPDKKLTNGGIVMEIKFFDNGTHVLCRNNQHRLFQIKFDNSILFQKMSVGEQLILMAYEHVKTM
jgi:hypothetical protein